MDSITVIIQSLTSLVFLAWVVMMFRTLFGIRSRMAARTGQTFPSLTNTLKGWGEWWQSDALRFERRLLIGLTIALLCTNAVMYAVLAP